MIDVQHPSDASGHVVAERIVNGAIEAYRTLPFHEVDAAAVARLTGVPEHQVTAAFPNWDALLLVTYDRWVELRAAARREQPTNTIDYVRLTLTEDVADPGLVRVLAGAINIAASETPFAALFRQRWEEYWQAIVAGLGRDFAVGTFTSVVPPEQAGTQLLALYEGLQMHMLVRPHIDVVRQYDVATKALLEGWSRQRPPSWDLDAWAM